MSNTRDTGFLRNAIQVTDQGVTFVSGSTTLMSISSSGAVTTTGVISGSNALSASFSLNSALLNGIGSVGFATTGALLEVSSSQQQISSSQQQISASLLNVVANYATTGSNSFRANQSITGSLVVSSTITAQTLVVQTVTSSIVYSSGSNIFGSATSNLQTFTGSIQASGSSTHFFLGGNVGIGTSSPNYGGWGLATSMLSSTSAGFEIATSRTTNNTSIGGLDWIQTSNTSNKEVAQISVLNMGITSGNTGADMLFYTKADAGSITERMRITSGGVVTVNQALSNYGAMAVKGNTDTYTYSGFNIYNNTNINFISIAINTTRAVIGADYAAGGSYMPLCFETGNTERMRITNSGSIGVGITSPQTNLSVKGIAANATALTYNGIFGLESVNQTSFQMGIGGTYNGTWFQSFNQPATGAGTFSLIFNPLGGNVGIGTTSPGALLHIYDASAGSTKTYTKYSCNDGGDIRIGKQDGVNNNAVFGTWSNNDIQIYGNSTERMRITSGGIVTQPYQPAFSIANGAALTGPGTVPFKNVIFDDGSNFNTSTYRFTAPVAGRYFFSFYDNIYANVSTSPSMEFRVNGTRRGAIAYTNTKTIGYWYIMSFQQVIKLSSGDYVEVYIANGDSPDYGGDYAWGNFSGYLIG